MHNQVNGRKTGIRASEPQRSEISINQMADNSKSRSLVETVQIVQDVEVVKIVKVVKKRRQERDERPEGLEEHDA
jgi:hypothetical protein